MEEALLVSKSSLTIKKLLYSAFHHLSPAHIYNSKKAAMDYPSGHLSLLIPAKHMGCRHKLSLKQSLKPFSGSRVRPSSVCQSTFYNKHILVKCSSPFYFYSFPNLLVLFSSQINFPTWKSSLRTNH